MQPLCDIISSLAYLTIFSRYRRAYIGCVQLHSHKSDWSD